MFFKFLIENLKLSYKIYLIKIMDIQLLAQLDFLALLDMLEHQNSLVVQMNCKEKFINNILNKLNRAINDGL